MNRIWKGSAIALLGAAFGCGEIDGPGEGQFVGNWHVVSVDGELLPTVLVSDRGLVHTMFSDLTLSVPARGVPAFGYDVSNLSAVDNSVTDHVACSGAVEISTNSDTLTLHASASGTTSCSKGAIEGERFVRNGLDLVYNWDGHTALLRSAP